MILHATTQKWGEDELSENAASAVEIGQHVLYVDELSRPRQALLTAVWRSQPYYTPMTPIPGVNIVLVSDDTRFEDSYGRQITRETSVVHVTNQVAPGRYWCLPSEYDAKRDADLRAANR